MRQLFLVLLLSSCGTVPNPFEKEDEIPEERITFNMAYKRLGAEFLHEGHFVVSRNNGKPEHKGEAILWAGIAAGALPCDKARPFMEFIASMAIENGGYFERYKPLGDDYGQRAINFDGMAGVYFGYAGYLSRCEASDDVKRSWEFHQKYLTESRGVLHPDVAETYPGPFDSVPQAISYISGLRSDPPSDDALSLVSGTASTWALGVVASKAACYRVHLAYLQLKALDMMGLPTGRDAFCKATGKIGKPEETAIGIPLIDHYCGRPGLKEFIENFQFNKWEYQFQRCSLWENPDGKGYATPGLDYLVGYSELYNARLK